MSQVFYIFNKIVSILLLVFGLYFLGVAFSFIFLGVTFYGGDFNILIDLLLELSLISIWLFSRAFINKPTTIKENTENSTNQPAKHQYKDWF